MSALPQYGKHLHPSETMRAAVIDRYGGPEVLRVATVPRPVPNRGQVLVRTRFIGVNPKDVIVRKGKFQVATGKKFPLIVGHDIAGEVVEAGLGGDLAVGDVVYGMINDFAGRAYAEYAAVDCQQLAIAPSSIDLSAAAAVPRIARRLASDDPTVVYTACRALQAIGPKAGPAAPGLAKLLASADARLGEEAGRTLAAIGPEAKAAVPALIEHLRDERPEVTWQCAKALAAMGPSADPAGEALAKALAADDPVLAAQAALSLAALSPSAARAALPEMARVLAAAGAADLHPRTLGCEAVLAEAGTAALPAMLAAFQDTRRAPRLKALILACGEDAVPLIEKQVAADPKGARKLTALLAAIRNP